MSKIGEKPIRIENNQKIEIKEGLISITGKEGTMSLDIPKGIKLTQMANVLKVEKTRADRRTRALHGTIRSIISNAIKGVENPWEKKLEVVGTGYKVKLVEEDLVFDVGYSHQVNFKNVSGIKLYVDGNIVTVAGVDRQLVGSVSKTIRYLKKPDPYKGKGIRYSGEILKLKPGKKAKTTTEAK